MKIKIISLIAASTACLVIVGCSLLGATPTAPTALESKLYDVQTNYVPVPVMVTNQVQTTNTVTLTNTVTQAVTVTNVVVSTPVVTTQTNETPTYTWTTKAGVTQGVQTGESLVNTFVPGVGGMIGTGLFALLSLWGYLRSSKLGDTSSALAQEVEAIREFIKTLPSGANYDQAITSFLQSHQVEAGVASQVLTILSKDVSNPEAAAAAKEIATAVTVASAPPKPA